MLGLKEKPVSDEVIEVDGVVSESALRFTRDFNKFVLIRGNRKVVEKHVRVLMKRMQEQGNLTTHFPIIVNERMEVIDGQHRLEALRRLSESGATNPDGEIIWVPFYRIEKGLNVENIRAINNGHRNWTWGDYLSSYISAGNDNYERFQNLIKHFELSYSITLYYCCGEGKSRHRDFKEGKLLIRNQTETFQLLKWYKEIMEVSEHNTEPFAIVMRQIMQHPEYDHARMKKKLAKYKILLKKFVARQDYLRTIEDIYNRGQGEDSKVRLF